VFSETDIINMLEFLIDNIFSMFGGQVLQQTVAIPMDINCASLLTNLFLYAYEADFIQGLLKKNEKKPARSFNFTFRYIDDSMATVCCKTCPPNIENMLSIKNSSMLMISVSENFYVESEYFTKRQTSYKDFSRKTKRSQPDPLISRSAI
jgi:hypothetical protein